MDIGNSTAGSPLSTPLDGRRATPNHAPSKNQPQNTAQSEKTPLSSAKGQNPTSAEAKQQALNDPSSALYKQLQALKNRDREVRTHEQTHLAAAGPYALGGPIYQYQRGPDGQRYVVGGHVNIDASEIAGDPEATLHKAETVRAPYSHLLNPHRRIDVSPHRRVV